MADGYYREAISSFSSSLERFYEAFVNAVSIQSGIKDDDFSASWKKVSSQSERQLGAYVFVHLLFLNLPPQLLSDQDVAYRNAVIHKGNIPSRAKAIEFANSVYLVINKGIASLKEHCPDGVRGLLHKNFQNAKQAAKISKPLHLAVGTALRLSQNDVVKKWSAEEWLVNHRGSWIKHGNIS
jgi:hypothetical protein